jgi:hypothetical protein
MPESLLSEETYTGSNLNKLAHICSEIHDFWLAHSTGHVEVMKQSTRLRPMGPADEHSMGRKRTLWFAQAVIREEDVPRAQVPVNELDFAESLDRCRTSINRLQWDPWEGNHTSCGIEQRSYDLLKRFELIKCSLKRGQADYASSLCLFGADVLEEGARPGTKALQHAITCPF